MNVMREYGKKTYNVNLESFKGRKKYLRHSEYTIYTDGSKNIPFTLMEVKRKKEQEEDSWYTTTRKKYTRTVSKC